MTERVCEALDKVAVEDPGDVLRFPLSLGPIRDDRDRSGERCHVLDIVFNSSVLREAQVSRCSGNTAAIPKLCWWYCCGAYETLIFL
jgi:hypothetical protein